MAWSGAGWPRLLLLLSLLALALPAAAERRPGPAGERGAGFGVRCGGWEAVAVPAGGVCGRRGCAAGRAASVTVCLPARQHPLGGEGWDPPLCRVICLFPTGPSLPRTVTRSGSALGEGAGAALPRLPSRRPARLEVS